MKPRSELPRNRELFQITVVLGNYKSREEADIHAMWVKKNISNAIDVSIKGSWSK